MSTTAAALTFEEFQQMPSPEGQRLELIEGEVVTMSLAGYPHERTKSNLTHIFAVWLAGNPVGRVFPETGVRLDRHNAPIPDVSVFLNERLTPGSTGPMQGAPELAMEVVSSESASHLETKIRLYLANGSRYVLVAYPEHRSIRVFDAAGNARLFDEQQTLEGLDDLLPGFRVPVAQIFEGV